MNPKQALFFLCLLTLLLGCTRQTAVISAPNSTDNNETTSSTVTTIIETPTLPLATPTPPAEITAHPVESSLAEIVLPIAIFIVDSEDEAIASDRTVRELTAVYNQVNNIWAQAKIRLDVQTIETIILSDTITRSIILGDFNPFFANVGQTFDVPNATLINGFYSKEIGGPNGIVPFRSRVFFVMDKPSVHDERVTSHEIGHILGLHHVLLDADRLMFSGTNGMMLNDEEIAVARYAAQGLLDGVR